MLCALLTGFTVSAADDLDNVTMEVTKKEFKRGHKMHFPSHDIIHKYMLENGDITQDEIDAMKAAKKSHREELKALKEAGDTDGFKAKLATLKAERDERKTALKEYINNNEELKAAIEERKEEMKEGHKRRHGKKHERKEKKEG